MIGVGVEELGVEEFVAGKFFDGELFIDTQKKSYQDLGFRRLGFFSAIGSILGKLGRAMISEAKSKGIEGNLKGDGMQNGGTIIVAAGGKVLLVYKQESPADHVALEDVLKALDISAAMPEGSTSSEPAECKDAASM